MKSKIDTLNLNEFSARVFEYIQNSSPEFLKNVKAKKGTMGKNYLIIEFEKIKPTLEDNTLSIVTDDNQITLIYDCLHGHFPCSDDLIFEPEIGKVLKLLKSIINNDTLLLKYLTGDKVFYTKLIEKEKLNPSEITHAKVISWNGSKDLIIDNRERFEKEKIEQEKFSIQNILKKVNQFFTE